MMAFLYADGDFKKTHSISTSAGLDSDNQPATLGGLIGVMREADQLPADYKMVFTNAAESPFYDTYVSHTRDGFPKETKISDLVERIANIAEDAILASGGRKVSRAGETVYLIQSSF